MSGLVLSSNAKRQWADWRDDSDTGYYVNVYFDFDEGFIRRETVKDGLTRRKAITLTNALNRAIQQLGNGRDGGQP